MYEALFFQEQLDTHFSLTDLLILSYDCFLPVYKSLQDTPTKQELIEAILAYCHNETKLNTLMNRIARINPMIHPNNWIVLVIEDDLSWQKRLKRHIRDLGCTVITANDYDEAKLELSNPKLTLVTVDLNLESEDYADGLDLLETIRDKFGPQFPIVVVSGTENHKQIIQVFRKYHVGDFIQKAEFSREEFIASLFKAVTNNSL